MTKIRWQIIFKLVLVLFLFGCQSAESNVVTTATPNSQPFTETTPAFTDAPTRQPTNLPAPPTLPPPSTSTPPSIEETIAPTETAVPPTPVIEGLITAPFPANVNPLTGEVVADSSVLQHRPIAIKITNGPANVRPQAGIGRADLIFEHLTEGGLTRFTAVFYSQIPQLAGPIRSARLIDMEIPVMYDAAFGFSGSVGLLKERIGESSYAERIVSPDFGHDGFFRMPNPDLPEWNTMFTNPPNLQFLLGERGEDRPPEFANNMVFHEDVINPSTPATRFELWYSGTNATWFYSNGRYLRWSDGEAHLDASTDQQLAFTNVVVVAANHVDTDIIEDTNGSPSIEIQIWGEGPVSVFRNGVRIDGRWHRTDPTHMLTFTDLDGNPLPLAPGNTFFQLVPLGFDKLTVTQ